MAWKAKVTSITRMMAMGGVEYGISVEFFDDASPATKYTKTKRVPHTVTQNQVLNAVKADLAELNAGEVLPTVVSPHLNEEIDENTTW